MSSPEAHLFPQRLRRVLVVIAANAVAVPLLEAHLPRPLPYLCGPRLAAALRQARRGRPVGGRQVLPRPRRVGLGGRLLLVELQIAHIRY